MSFTSELLSYKPASDWELCFPIGNGNIGVMQYGNLTDDVLFVNDDRFWSGTGEHRQYENTTIESVRKNVLDGELAKAQSELWKGVLGDFTEGYLPFFELHIKRANIGKENYARKLDFACGTHTVSSSTYFARSFVSALDKICVYRIDCDKTAEHSFEITSPVKYTASFDNSRKQIIVNLQAPSHVDPIYLPSKNPIIFDGKQSSLKGCAIISIDTDGDITSLSPKPRIINASFIELRISTAVDKNLDKLKETCEKTLLASSTKNFELLLELHSKNFASLYNRSSFRLSQTANLDGVSTAQILKKKKKSNALAVLLFNFGKYLMISGSRKGTTCMNLQGIWNKDIRPRWSSNYTTNINTEMNYWGAESVNLSECHLPMMDLIRKISINGKISAKWQFGIDNGGWTLGQNSDNFGHSDHVGRNSNSDPASWGLFVGGGGWMASHIWLHYLYTQDKKFLQDNFDILRDCAKFYLAYLTQDPESNYLIACPSCSPENTFFSKGLPRAINKCSTMDISIIEQLFDIVVSASAILNTNDPVAKQCKEALPKLLPLKIGSKGQLLEWYGDYKETAKHHRHTSHLYALHPYWKISPLSTPELAEACRVTLHRRGCGGTGWSLAWKINMYARLFDGEMALKLLRNQLYLIKPNAGLSMGHGGSYENLFCAHPPFQIDGNFGAMSGISEMLLQSHHGIHILPALPHEWQNGSFENFKAQGNYTVSCEWKNGKIYTLQIDGIGENLEVLLIDKKATIALNKLIKF